MGVLDTITDIANTVGSLRKKPAPPPKEVPRHMKRVKTPAEYEEEDRLAAEGKAPPKGDTQTHKLVPDSVFNYGQE